MARLSSTERTELPDRAFAYVDSQGNRRLPIHDAAHVRNALARFGQVRFEDDAARERARTRLLKAAQRDWCLARGIDVVTWTMDPMVARNAWFNLHKLGAVGVAFHRDYYGPMDDTFNRGERSDRLEFRWDLRSDVDVAVEGGGA